MSSTDFYLNQEIVTELSEIRKQLKASNLLKLAEMYEEGGDNHSHARYWDQAEALINDAEQAKQAEQVEMNYEEFRLSTLEHLADQWEGQDRGTDLDFIDDVVKCAWKTWKVWQEVVK